MWRLILLFSLAGCATTQAERNDIASGFVGKRYEDVTLNLGAPGKETQLSGGERMVQYDFDRGLVYNVRQWCRVNLVVASDSTVKRAQVDGNRCK